jgi:hypothetical protein
MRISTRLATTKMNDDEMNDRNKYKGFEEQEMIFIQGLVAQKYNNWLSEINSGRLALFALLRGVCAKKKRVALATIGALLITMAGTVQAASVSYYLDQSNLSTGPLVDGTNYLKVTIDDQGSPGLINFTVQTLPALNSIAGSNFGIQTFALNTLIDTSTLPDSAIVNLPSGWSGNVVPPPNTIDGFGMFDISVDNGGSNRLTTLTFSINFAGDTISDYLDLSSGSASQGNVFFAAHVGGFDDGAGNTSAFFGGPTAVPLPAAAWLFGSGLFGLVALARRRRLT